jgi:hypothetical protein
LLIFFLKKKKKKKRGAKSTSDPKSSMVLHLGEFGNLALMAGTRVIPEFEAICRNGYNI